MSPMCTCCLYFSTFRGRIYRFVRFATLLDSSKTGLRLRAGVFQRDQKDFGGQVPEQHVGKRSKRHQPFVLHAMVEAGNRIEKQLLKEYDDGAQHQERSDSDLARPYDLASTYAQAASDNDQIPHFMDELALIKKHVDQAYEEWIDACHALKREKGKEDLMDKKPKPKKKKGEDVMLRASQIYAEDVGGVRLTPNVGELKASYAYKRSSSFGFSVAFQELCLIKAKASSGGIAPTIRLFDEVKIVSSSCLRVLAKVDEGQI